MLPSDKVDHDQLFLLPFLEKLDVESGLKNISLFQITLNQSDIVTISSINICNTWSIFLDK